MTPHLRLTRLAKRYADTEAVRGVDLEIAPGEFVSLLGPSGCGKSTTLAMVAGFEKPTSGDILIAGRSVLDTPPGKRRVGLVFQDYAIFSRLTVGENLAFGLEAQGVARSEKNRRLGGVVERLGLGELLARRGSSLNMSEMQRVAIARVIVTEPLLLLLDEPMSNLDSATRSSLRGELRRMQRALGQSVLYVTHDQIEAMSMSDRVAVMRDGRIEQVGSPREVYDRPSTRFVAEFIGEPPINFLPCSVARSGARATVETALHRSPELMIDTDGRDQLVGLRPQALLAAKEKFPGAVETTVRFVEFLGADHVLHVDYGQQLAAVVAAPDIGKPGHQIWLGVEWANACLVRPGADQAISVGVS